MVRTKADNCSKKAVAAKAPRKVLGGGGATHSPGSSSGMSSPSSAKVSKYAGGNPACVRPTPEWQKGISTFLKKSANEGEEKENGNENGAEVMEEAEAVMEENAGASSQTSSSSADSADLQSTPLQRNGIIDDSDED